MLAGAEGANETAKEPSSPKVESLRLVEPKKESDEPTQVQVAGKEPSVEWVVGLE